MKYRLGFSLYALSYGNKTKTVKEPLKSPLGAALEID